MAGIPTFLDLALELTEIRTLTGALSAFDEAFLALRAELDKCLPPIRRFVLERPEDLDNVRVKIAVIGNSSTGKSTFINAILGSSVCPMKEGGSGAAGYTSFRYADHEEIHHVTHSRKGVIRELLSFEQYNIRVAANGDVGGWFEYGYPSHVLRDIELIDTPGFSSISRQVDILTDRIVKESDVALVVFDINDYEPKSDLLQRLKSIREGADSQLIRLFLVLNKTDVIQDEYLRNSTCKAFEKMCLFDDIHLVSAREMLRSCNFNDLADVGPRLRESINHVIKQSGGGPWSLDVKLASDRPRQYALDISVNGDVNTPDTRRMALIKALSAIKCNKSISLQDQRTREIQHYLMHIQLVLDRVRTQCTVSSQGIECVTVFDAAKYWNLVHDIKVRIENILEANLNYCFSYEEVLEGGVVGSRFATKGKFQLDLVALQDIAERLELPLLDFSIELLQRNVIDDYFASRDELLALLRKPFNEDVVDALREVQVFYENKSGSVRRGSTLEWRLNDLQDAIDLRNEWVAEIIVSVSEYLNEFFTSSWWRFQAIAEANDADFSVQRERQAALALENSKHIESALESIACLLNAH